MAVNASSNSGITNFTVSSCRVWDVKVTSARKHILGGHFAPSFKRKKRRRVSIEVLQPVRSKSTSRTRLVDENDEVAAGKNSLMLGLLSGDKSSSVIEGTLELSMGDKVVLKFLKPIPMKKIVRSSSNSYLDKSVNSSFSLDDDDDDDDDRFDNGDNETCSMSSLGILGATDEPENDAWVEDKCYDINFVRIVSRKQNTMEIIFAREANKVRRKIIFNNGQDSRRFFQMLLSLQTSTFHDKGFRSLSLPIEDSISSVQTDVKQLYLEDAIHPLKEESPLKKDLKPLYEDDSNHSPKEESKSVCIETLNSSEEVPDAILLGEIFNMVHEVSKPVPQVSFEGETSDEDNIGYQKNSKVCQFPVFSFCNPSNNNR